MDKFKVPFLLSLILSLTACGGDEKETVKVLEKNEIHLPLVENTITQINIQNLKYPDKEYEAILVSDSTFNVSVPASENDDLFLISFGTPYDWQEEEYDFESGDLEVTYGTLLLKGNEINHSKFSLNILTDYIGQNISGLYGKLTSNQIIDLQNRYAESFISKDLNNDGKIDVKDALIFNPHKSNHTQSLAFDYKNVVNETLENFGDLTLQQIYKEQPSNRISALKELIGGYISNELPELHEIRLSSLSVSISNGGVLQAQNLNNVAELNDENQRLEYVFNEQDRNKKITLTATPVEGYIFDKWVGCDQVNAQEQCEIQVDEEDKTISAQFKSSAEDELLIPKNTYIKLSEVNNSDYLISTLTSTNRLTIHFKNNTEAERVITNIQVGDVVATLTNEANLFKVLNIVDVKNNHVVFEYEHVELSDIYDVVNLDIDDYLPNVQDVQQIQFGSDENNLLTAGINNPKIWIDGYGVAVHVKDDIYLVNDPRFSNVMTFIQYGNSQNLQANTNDLNAKRELCFFNPSSQGCPNLLQNKRYLSSLKELASDPNNSAQLQQQYDFRFGVNPKKIGDLKKDKYQALVGGAVVGHFLFTNNSNFDFYHKGMKFKLTGQTVGKVELLMDMEVWFAISSAEKNKGIISYVETGAKGKKSKKDVQVNGLAYSVDDINRVFQQDRSKFSDLNRTNIETFKSIINDPNKQVVDVKIDSKEQDIEFTHVNTMFYIPTPVGVAIPFNVGTDVTLYVKGYLGINANLRALAGFSYSMNASAEWMKVFPKAKANAKISPYFDASLTAGAEAGVGLRPAFKLSVGTGIEKLVPRMLNFNAELSTPFTALAVGEFTFFDTFKKQYLCGTGVGAFNLKTRLESGASIDLADGELKKKVPKITKFLFKEYNIVKVPTVEFNLIDPKVFYLNNCS